VCRGRISPADRAHLAARLARFAVADGPVKLAVEACTGWRYVAAELAAAGVVAHLAEPAETTVLRGPKRRPKTDKADARHLRELLGAGRLPECWIPPAHILECRALLECYHDLRMAHTGWTQRVHAACSTRARRRWAWGCLAPSRAVSGWAAVPAVAPVGRLQVQTAVGDAAGDPGPAGRGRPPVAWRLPPPCGCHGAGAAPVRGGADHRAGLVLLAGRGADGSPLPARRCGLSAWT
jgi:hypothetical protein